MNDQPISISVVMPAYNEEMSIVDAVKQNIETFSSQNLDYEIVIIDDNSTDRSWEIIKELAEKYPEVFCYHHEKNLGPGGAFQTGVTKAKKEYIIFVPFDNPLTIDDLKSYIPRLGICDVVVGVRAERVGYNYFAKVASFLYNRIMIPLLFNIGVSDVNWIQVYRRHYFEDGTLNIGKTKIFFLVELLIQARRNNLIIVEIPSAMNRRLYGIPTCTRFSVMWATFWDAIKFFIKSNKG